MAKQKLTLHATIKVQGEGRMEEPQAPKIQANWIIYADHYIACDLDCYSPVYMADMEVCLTRGGSIAQHHKDLVKHNNDGTWTIHAVKGN